MRDFAGSRSCKFKGLRLQRKRVFGFYINRQYRLGLIAGGYRSFCPLGNGNFLHGHRLRFKLGNHGFKSVLQVIVARNGFQIYSKRTVGRHGTHNNRLSVVHHRIDTVLILLLAVVNNHYVVVGCNRTVLVFIDIDFREVNLHPLARSCRHKSDNTLKLE